MKILVTGGTGFVGQHLARALLNQGHEVYLLGRDFRQSQVQQLIGDGALPVVADLRDEKAVVRACEHMELVYHVGALSAAWGRYEDFYEINVGGTEVVIAGCLIHKVKRLVYVSSPSVVFNGKDQLEVTEDVAYPKRFVSVYSWTKKIGEDRVNAVADKLPIVILRPKAIFGPGDRSLLPQLIAAARRGRLPQIGDGRNLVDLTYVENVVDALLLAGSSEAAIGKMYTITNGEHVLLWDVIYQVLRRLHLSTRLKKISLPVALAVASMMELQARVTGKDPLLTTYSAAILARTQTYNISAAQNDLGYQPRISVAEGIERTLAALEEER